MKVFIVEDCGVMREHLHLMLSDIPGIAVIEHTADGTSVIEHINALLPDVVILNISRQIESWIDMLESIKKCHAAIKIMVLVNYIDKCYVDRCIGAGADYLFDKSFPFIRFRAALWKLVHANVLSDKLVTSQ